MFRNYSITFVALAHVNAVQLHREPLLGWKPKAAKSHPMDYFVPNFGQSDEVKDVNQSLKASEKLYNRKWVVKDTKGKKDEYPTNYFVPNFGVDSDIAMTT